MNDEGRPEERPGVYPPETLPLRPAGPPPAVVVTFEFEASPKVRVVASTQEDYDRLALWLEGQAVYSEFVRAAIALERETTA
jgi:hypothetical protein